jgi:hypothetical protein
MLVVTELCSSINEQRHALGTKNMKFHHDNPKPHVANVRMCKILKLKH